MEVMYHLPNFKMEFDNTMDFVKYVLEYEQKNDQIIILDYVMEIIKKDIQYDLLTTILYDKDFTKQIRFIFPYNYYDEQGNECNIVNKKKTKKRIDLSTDCVIVLPWCRERMVSQAKNIGNNNFTYYPSNHLAYYFTYIDLCYVYNGTHSIASGIGHRKGYIEATIYDISKLFDHVYTDGVHWYNSHNNKKYSIDLVDFRIGIIYEIAKIKYRLENHNLL